jgi:hypothetical protein
MLNFINMERYLLLIREDLERVSRETDEERMKAIQEMMRWGESLAESGNYLGGEPLLTNGKYVTGDQVISDGPFIEAKEGISGYITIQAENLNQAASIAQGCPRVMRNIMTIEVRPVLVLNQE